MDGRARRSCVHERRTRDAHGRRWAISAAFDGTGWTPASLAPRWDEHLERGEARTAERPRTRGAARTSGWEHDVERPSDHGAKLSATADIVRTGVRAGRAGSGWGGRGYRSSASTASA
jgi:hypothetical protein